VSFSPDSQLVAVAFFDLGLLRVWNAKDGNEKVTIRIGKKDDRVYFWPDSKRVATNSSWEKINRIWDLETGECIRTFEGH
ncbi:hypothetical protein V8F20_012154, partial [Naviculisporaceae sp. PSN 640]